MRQMALQPVAALRQRLVLRIDTLDAFERGVGDQRVIYLEIELRDDLEIALDETIQRFAHRAFGGVLDRNDRVIRLAFLYGSEDVADRRHRVVIDAGPEFL